MLNYIVLQIQHPELLLITKLKRETKGNWLPPYKSFWNMDELSILLYVYVAGFSSGHYDKFTKLISLMFHLGDTLVREMNSVFVFMFFYLERIVVETFFFSVLFIWFVFVLYHIQQWLGGKESACQCRRHGFDPWIGKIPWRRTWQPTSVSAEVQPRQDQEYPRDEWRRWGRQTDRQTHRRLHRSSSFF